MSKKLLWVVTSMFALLFILPRAQAQEAVNLFDIPDSVCAGSFITPTNVTDSASNYSWYFCPPDLFAAPESVKANNSSLTFYQSPVGVALLRDNGVSFTYRFNKNGDLIRSRYLDGYEGQPSLVTIVGHVENPRGITSIKDDNGIYHLFVISGTNTTNSELTRFDFRRGIQTFPTDTVLVATFGDFRGPKQLLIVRDVHTWYGFTFDKNDALVKLTFGSDLFTGPTDSILGNIDNRFSDVSGLAGINELGDWHLLVTNKGNNTIDRISFGNSFENTPFVINLGDFNHQIKRPVGISITRGCQSYYGYVLNYGTNSLIVLKWDAQSIANQPVANNFGNIADFQEPYFLSKFTDEDGNLFMYALNKGDSSISKIIYKSCTNSTIAHSSEKDPTPFAYNEPGVYDIYLTIDQGLPSVRTACKHITVTAHAPITISNDTLICEGDKIRLNALSFGADSILWQPDYKIDTLKGFYVHVDPRYSTKYIATTYFAPNCIVPDTVTVMVSKITADAGPDRAIADGSTTIIGGAKTTLGNQYTYEWTPNIAFTGSTGDPITEVRPPYDITYYLHVSNTDGCSAIDSVNVRVPCDDIHLPNAFSPESNNSRVNKFRLLNLQFVKINYFKIFDRWGNEVFSTTNPSKGWDGNVNGEPAPMGVYVWEVDANCANSFQRYRKSGTVTLLR